MSSRKKIEITRAISKTFSPKFVKHKKHMAGLLTRPVFDAFPPRSFETVAKDFQKQAGLTAAGTAPEWPNGKVSPDSHIKVFPVKEKSTNRCKSSILFFTSYQQAKQTKHLNPTIDTNL